MGFDRGLTGFLNDVRALARFDRYPGIVGVKGFVRAHGTGYMVMESVPGITFKTYLKRRGGRIPCADALALLRPVMDVRAVHQVDLQPGRAWACADAGGLALSLVPGGGDQGVACAGVGSGGT